MLRPLLFLFLASLAARASEAIPLPGGPVGNRVSQPHVTAELIPETANVRPGQPFLVALHLHMDPDWHTYWINPGDAGLATTIKWTLPPGFTAGPIQWPAPERHPMGPLTTYGYGGDAYLLTTITPPAPVKFPLEIRAQANWLVCQEECIPGKADLALKLGAPGPDSPDREKFFAEARARLPVPNTRWDVQAAYGPGGGTVDQQHEALWIYFSAKPPMDTRPLGKVYFFPEQPNVLAADESDNGMPEPDQELRGFELPLTLQQNGEKTRPARRRARFRPAPAGEFHRDLPPAVFHPLKRSVPEYRSRWEEPGRGRFGDTGASQEAGSGEISAKQIRRQPCSAAGRKTVAPRRPRRGVSRRADPEPDAVRAAGAFAEGLFPHAPRGRRSAPGVAAGRGLHRGRGGLLLGPGGAAHRPARGREPSRLGLPDAVARLRARADLSFLPARAESVRDLRTGDVAGRARRQGCAPGGTRADFLLPQRRAGHAGGDPLHRAVHGLVDRLRGRTAAPGGAAGLHRARARHGRALPAPDPLSGRAPLRPETGGPGWRPSASSWASCSWRR